MAEDLGPVFFFDFDVTFRLSDFLVVSRSFFKSGMWNSYTPHRKDRDVKKTLFCGGMGETWQSEGWSNSTPGQLLPRVFGRCRVLEDDVLGTCLNDDCLVYDFRIFSLWMEFCGKKRTAIRPFFQTSSWRFIVSSVGEAQRCCALFFYPSSITLLGTNIWYPSQKALWKIISLGIENPDDLFHFTMFFFRRMRISKALVVKFPSKITQLVVGSKNPAVDDVLTPLKYSTYCWWKKSS